MDEKIHSIEKLLFVLLKRHTAFNFQSAFTGAFAGESLPHPGTSLRLRMRHTPLGFSMHLSFERLILYQITKSAACFIGGLVTGEGRRHLRSVFSKKQIGGTKIAGLSQK